MPLVGRADTKGSTEADNVGSVKLENDSGAEVDNDGGPKLGSEAGSDIGTAGSPESDTEGSEDVTLVTETAIFVEVLNPKEVPTLVDEGRTPPGMLIKGRPEMLGLPPGARTPSIALISVLNCCRAATTTVRGSTPGGTTTPGVIMLLGTTLDDGKLGAEITPVVGKEGAETRLSETIGPGMGPPGMMLSAEGKMDAEVVGTTEAPIAGDPRSVVFRGSGTLGALIWN